MLSRQGWKEQERREKEERFFRIVMEQQEVYACRGVFCEAKGQASEMQAVKPGGLVYRLWPLCESHASSFRHDGIVVVSLEEAQKELVALWDNVSPFGLRGLIKKLQAEQAP